MNTLRQVLVLLCFCLCLPALANTASGLEIGDPLPNFSLPGVDDRNYSPADFADADVLLVIFTCNHCPTAQAYEERIMQLQRDYQDKGVALLAISPNDPKAVRLDELSYSDLNDSLEDMKIRAKDKNFNFPYVYDGETQVLSRKFGAIATPHVYIFDKQRKLRYKGRIDDSEAGTPKRQDTRAALDALLAGKPVEVEHTRVFGCSVKWSEKVKDGEEFIKRWDAEPVDLEKIDAKGVAALAANPTDKYRLVNLWATWCAPCIIELPELVEINRMYRGRHFEFITISLDDPEKFNNALAVLKKKKVAAQNYLFNSDDRDAVYEALDPASQGGAPYTVLIAPGGEVVWRKHGPINSLETRRVIADTLGRTYADDPVKK